MKKVNIFCHSFQKVKSIYYIDSLHSEIFQAFISWNFDDYGLQINKSKIQCLRKLEYYIRSIKKDILNRNVRPLKIVHFYALNTWLGFLLHELLHQCGVAWRQSACGTAQV